MSKRPQISEPNETQALREVAAMVHERLHQKGRGIFTSSHEMYGVVAEEVHELLHEIENGSGPGVADELLDVAVAATIGLASCKSGETDWL